MFSLFGRGIGIRLSHCGARSGAALNVHRTFIHSRAASNPYYQNEIKKTPPIGDVFFIWQRNRDSNPNKQSQSLSCYRYTIPLNALLLYTPNGVLSSLFLKNFHLFLLFILWNKKHRCGLNFRTDERYFFSFTAGKRRLCQEAVRSLRGSAEWKRVLVQLLHP